VDERSCAVSFQAVILWLPLFTLRKGSQDLLSYTTRRGATEALGIELRRPPSDSAFRYFFR
jgi:hypothetical protein